MTTSILFNINAFALPYHLILLDLHFILSFHSHLPPFSHWTWCVYSCGVMLFPQLFRSIHLSPLSFPSNARPDEDSGWLWEQWGWLEVCVWETSPCEWVVGDDPSLSSTVCVCGGLGPLDDYLQGSISRWIEPPLCFTAGLSRTLRSQCMIHYPIRGRVTHPWVILSNPDAHAQPSRCSLY